MEKKVIRTTDTLFYNSQCLFIEYHDILDDKVENETRKESNNSSPLKLDNNRIIKGENKQKGQQKTKNNYAIDYYNQILLSPFRQRSKEYFRKQVKLAF